MTHDTRIDDEISANKHVNKLLARKYAKSSQMMRQTDQAKRHSHARAAIKRIRRVAYSTHIHTYIEQAEHVQRKKISVSVGQPWEIIPSASFVLQPTARTKNSFLPVQ